MRNVISIDPGRKLISLARWAESGLVEVLAVEAEAPSPAMPGSAQLASLADFYAEALPIAADVAVVERMVHYPGQRKDSRATELAKAADLLELQALSMYLAGRLARNVVLYTAAEWKGQAPEDVTTMRVVRALSESEPELAALQAGLGRLPRKLHHNLYDAVGIGLHYFGRFKKGRP